MSTLNPAPKPTLNRNCTKVISTSEVLQISHLVKYVQIGCEIGMQQ